MPTSTRILIPKRPDDPVDPIHSQQAPRPSPLAWGIARRMTVALTASASLWLAVAWALGWGS